MTAKLEKKKQRNCDVYYNSEQSDIFDEIYDKLLDELETQENETGCKLSNSPVKRVGFDAVDRLKKHKHEKALLSLEKTKNLEEL